MFAFRDAKELETYWMGKSKFEATADGAKVVPAEASAHGSQASLESRFGLTGDFDIAMVVQLGRSRYSNTGDTCFITCGERFEITGRQEWHAISLNITIQRRGDQLTFTSNSASTTRTVKAEELPKPARLCWHWRSRSAQIRGIRVVADGVVPDTDESGQ
jgi:hypothetical protein